MVHSFLWWSTYVAYFDSKQQLALFGRLRLWRYQVDTARDDSAGRLVKPANRQTELLFATGQPSLTGPDNS